jgi:hypothetical protein
MSGGESSGDEEGTNDSQRGRRNLRTREINPLRPKRDSSITTMVAPQSHPDRQCMPADAGS